MKTEQIKETPFSKKLYELSEKQYKYMDLADMYAALGNLKKEKYYRRLEQKYFDLKYAHVDTLFPTARV